MLFTDLVAGTVFAKAITLVVGFPAEIPLWQVTLDLIRAAAVGSESTWHARFSLLDPIVALRSEL